MCEVGFTIEVAKVLGFLFCAFVIFVSIVLITRP